MFFISPVESFILIENLRNSLHWEFWYEISNSDARQGQNFNKNLKILDEYN